uniref:Transmembrane serine protease 5 n=1 Tax=Hippocampus comes TaxID=109280 RepID=A0A3Q3DQ10_HIPCM
MFLPLSQISPEAVFLSQCSGTGGHKRDFFLQCDRGHCHRRPQERSVSFHVGYFLNCFVFHFFLAFQECGTRAKLARIIGGVEATLGRWPWQVSLYYSNRHTCGGSIITSQWIVTAAHCVPGDSVPFHAWTPLLCFQNPTGHAVEKIVYNKNYNHVSHDSDIALMKLRTPLNFSGPSDTVRPVCLPQFDYDPPGGTQCWISGWGYTQPDGVHSSDTLKEAPVPIISTNKCNSSCMYNGEITPRMLCAGYSEGKVDACQGDSGGPLVCQDDNVWRLMGVVSWGNGCAEPNHPGVYTKVAKFLGWIYEIMEVNLFIHNTCQFTLQCRKSSSL